MSDPSMKPDRTWHDIAMEMSAEQDPQKMMRLAEELNSAFERDDANRAQSHEPPYQNDSVSRSRLKSWAALLTLFLLRPNTSVIVSV